MDGARWPRPRADMAARDRVVVTASERVNRTRGAAISETRAWCGSSSAG